MFVAAHQHSAVPSHQAHPAMHRSMCRTVGRPQTHSFRAGMVDGAYQQQVVCAGGYKPDRADHVPKREGGYATSRRQSLHLEHAQGLEKECDIEGPFDVVLMDLALPRLLHALLQVCVLPSFNFNTLHMSLSHTPCRVWVIRACMGVLYLLLKAWIAPSIHVFGSYMIEDMLVTRQMLPFIAALSCGPTRA